VNFQISPSSIGSAATLSPITGSGSSTMTVDTSGLAKANYTITITGNSGTLTHSTTVSLRVH
jgi:hypothetical protein